LDFPASDFFSSNFPCSVKSNANQLTLANLCPLLRPINRPHLKKVFKLLLASPEFWQNEFGEKRLPPVNNATSGGPKTVSSSSYQDGVKQKLDLGNKMKGQRSLLFLSMFIQLSSNFSEALVPPPKIFDFPIYR